MNRQPNKIPDSLKTIDVKAILRKRGIYLQQSENQELKALAMPLVKQLKKKNKKVDQADIEKAIAEVKATRRSLHFTNDEIHAYWEKQIRAVEVVEQHFENKLTQFIVDVKTSFLKHFDEEVGNRKGLNKLKKKDYFDDNEEALLAKAQLDFKPLLQSVAIAAGNHANKLIGIDDPYIPFGYEAQIARNVTKFTQSMLDSDRQKLIGIIDNGLESGASVPDIRKEIEDTFDIYSKTQAERITRTEVLRTSNQATIDAFEQSGVVEGKQWVTYGADDECANYEGQVVGLKDSFYDGDNEFQDGDPPLHPNCKCVVIPIVEKASNKD